MKDNQEVREKVARMRAATFYAQNSRYQGSMKSDDDMASVSVGDLRAILTLLSPTFLAENAKKEGWQPIETAPRDATEQACGTSVLLVWQNGEVSTGRWRFNHRTGTYYFTDSDEYDDYETADYPPTHWMPLPMPPTPLPNPAQAVGEKG